MSLRYLGSGMSISGGLHPRGEEWPRGLRQSFPGSSQDDPVLPTGWPLLWGMLPATNAAPHLLTQIYQGAGQALLIPPCSTSFIAKGMAFEETARRKSAG